MDLQPGTRYNAQKTSPLWLLFSVENATTESVAQMTVFAATRYCLSVMGHCSAPVSLLGSSSSGSGRPRRMYFIMYAVERREAMLSMHRSLWDPVDVE